MSDTTDETMVEVMAIATYDFGKSYMVPKRIVDLPADDPEREGFLRNLWVSCDPGEYDERERSLATVVLVTGPGTDDGDDLVLWECG